MEIVLGVSMTPVAVQMALVEGADGDGVTVDAEAFAAGPRAGGHGGDAVRQVVAAILGTRESAAGSGHRLSSVGIAWSDHDDAARLRTELRARRIDDVVLVSELHAAGALAQAVGRKTGCGRIALMFLERDKATLAVVRTADGAVVGVQSRSLQAQDAVADLQEMVAALDRAGQPPQAVFLVGSGLNHGIDVAALSGRLTECTAVPVHAPDRAELALARGAALASANAPRFEAATVGLAPAGDGRTAAVITQLGQLNPLGYSAVPDDEDDDVESGEPGEPEEAEQNSFLLMGSALVSIFVVGILALAMSLAVSIRPTVDQRSDPQRSAAATGVQAPVQGAGESAAIPETIEAPTPVVRVAPQTVFVPRPGAPAPQAVPAPVVAAFAPPPDPAPAAVPMAPAPVAPMAPAPVAPMAPAPVAPMAPAPVAPPVAQAPAPRIVVAPIPILPRLLSPIARAPRHRAPPSVAQAPEAADPAQGAADSAPSSSGGGPLWPLWPGIGR